MILRRAWWWCPCLLIVLISVNIVSTREFDEALDRIRHLADAPIEAGLKSDGTDGPRVVADADVVDREQHSRASSSREKLKRSRFREKKPVPIESNASSSKRSRRKKGKTKKVKKKDSMSVKPSVVVDDSHSFPEAELLSAFDLPHGNFPKVIAKAKQQEKVVRAKLKRAERASEKIAAYHRQLAALHRQATVARKQQELTQLASKLKQENMDEKKLDSALTKARDRYTTLQKTKLSLESERLSTKQQLEHLITDVKLNWHS